jgi:hypothetical protein
MQLFSRFTIVSVIISVFVLATIIPGNFPVSGASCQIRGVSYTFPKQALSNQKIQVGTTVAGSCPTDVYRFYLLRADLSDKRSGLIISSNSTPIGYDAKNFTVTVLNMAITPQESNATWPLEVHVYVILTGKGSGSYLLDYSTTGEIQIQIGATAIPEFPRQAAAALLLTGSVGLTFLLAERQRRLKKRHS